MVFRKGKVTHSKVFANDFGSGSSDGMRGDVDGKIWCTMGWDDPNEDGVRWKADI